MSELTPRLGLPLIGDHAQKHLVLNAGLMRLESLVQAQVLSRTTAAEPVSPADGDSYILAPSPTGTVWASLSAGDFVRAESGTWEREAFPAGALVHVADENRFLLRTATGWAAFEDAIAALDNLNHLGIGTAADSYNVLALKGAAALLTAKDTGSGGSGDLSLVLNKEASGNSAQILLQTAYASHAILGLLGDDDLTLKVSPDGASFLSALSVNKTTGAVTLPQGLAGTGSSAGRLGGQVVAVTLNLNGGAAVGANFSAGAGNTRGFVMPFAGKLLNATLSILGGSNGTLTVEALAGGSLNSSYTLSATYAGSPIDHLHDFQSSPLSLSAGATLNWQVTATPGSAMVAFVTLYVQFD